MTIGEAISYIDELKPNQYTSTMKRGWLSRLDNTIYENIYKTHEGNTYESFSGYTDDTEDTTELLVPEPYTEIYRYWLESQIDYANQEISKYNNSSAMYNNVYTEFSNYYNSKHMPVHSVNGPIFYRR